MCHLNFSWKWFLNYLCYTQNVAHSCTQHIAHTVLQFTAYCSTRRCTSDQLLPCTASLPHSWLTPCLCRDSLLVFIRRARIFPATTLSYLVACLPAQSLKTDFPTSCHLPVPEGDTLPLSDSGTSLLLLEQVAPIDH